MSYTTGNMTNLTRQELYSLALLTSFDDFVIDQPLFRDYTSEFPDGDTLNIDQVGDRSWTDYDENTPIDFSGVDTNRLPLTVNQYKQDAFYITDKAKQDSWKSDRFFAENVKQSAQRIREDMQSDLFKTANESQTAGNANTINGQPHRIAGSGTGDNLDLVDIAKLKLAFDKARVPQNGRILILDATQEFALNTLTGNVINVDNPQFQGIVNTGFARDNKFIRNIYGFDIWVSDLLPRVASETLDDSLGNSTTITNGVANLAMYVGDENKTAMMGVMRQAPTPAFERQERLKRDEWSATARWGYGLQRAECLGVLVTNMA